MATQSFVQIAPDSTGKKIDNVQLLQDDASTIVQRQVTVQGDPTNIDNLQQITGAGAAKVDPSGVVSPSNVAPAVTPQLTNTPFNSSSSGDQQLVAGQSGKKIKLHRVILSVDGQTLLSLTNGNSGSVLYGPAPFFPGAGLALDFSGEPWATTTTGTDLVVHTSAAVTVGGMASYVQA